MSVNKSDVYCVIGAGPSGLAAAKNLLEKNIQCEVLEKHDDIGGIWNISNPQSTCYENTYTITSKEVTAYTDFPFPEDSPDYLHHVKVFNYLKSYATKFDLYSVISFNTEVTKVTRQGKLWEVTYGGQAYQYKGLIIANGHNWLPKYPKYQGEYTGEVFHSAEYKKPDHFKDKDVLVVGAGNTGCDIAVETSHVTKSTCISMRRGYHFVPKYIFGIPADKLGQGSQSTLVPLRLVRFIYKLLLKMTVGNPQKYGLPKPDHELLESPPIVNNLLPYYVSHQRVSVATDIDRCDGKIVTFKDGSAKKYDAIIYATGYQIAFPFIDKEYLSWRDGKPDFYIMAFHPEYDNFFIAGLTDGTGGHFPTADLQTKVIASYIDAHSKGHQLAKEIDERKSKGSWDFSRGIRFIESSRSLTQFELVSFTQHMSKLIKSYST